LTNTAGGTNAAGLFVGRTAVEEPCDLIRHAQRALTTNSTASSFASKVPTITEPSNDGVIDLFSKSILQPKSVKLWFIGLGADNDAFSIRVIGWQRIGSGLAPGILWFPSVICELACVISAAVGVAGSPVLNTERFADTITIVSEPTITADVTRLGTIELNSPTGDLIAPAVVPLRGFEKLEFLFDQTTNTPTMNVLYSLV
jgi:hypothetical protein